MQFFTCPEKLLIKHQNIEILFILEKSIITARIFIINWLSNFVIFLNHFERVIDKTS